MDLLKLETCNYSHNFMLSLQSYFFTPTIDKPTRVYNNSATIIDNIFTNNPEALKSGNLVSDISDHFSQFCLNFSIKENNKYKGKKMRDFSKFRANAFNSELANIVLVSEHDNILDIDKTFSSFYKKLNSLTNKFAPLKLISSRKRKQFLKPWITSGIRTSIKTKNKLFFSGNYNKYKLYRNKLSSLIRMSKKSHFSSIQYYVKKLNMKLN